MSRETRTDFHYGQQHNGNMIITTLPYNLAKAVVLLNKKYKSDISNTIRALLYTAFKNNFTPAPEFKYIPCKPQSDFLSYALPKNVKPEFKSINFSFSASKNGLFKNITAIAENYACSISECVRMLLSISLQYNYDNNFNYIKAVPLSENENIYIKENDMPKIFLDFI